MIIILLAVIALYVFSLTFRLFLSCPFYFLKKIPLDIWNYFRKYRWIPKKPFINVYCGLFGSGKTLSAVHDVRMFYDRYNDRIVWDDRQDKFVTQKVQIFSNVDLKGISYIPFTGLKQIVEIAKTKHEDDKKKGVRTVTIVLGDEFSVQMNSRSFKTNIDPLFLNALLTSRHSLIHAFYLTSQRFEHMDALLRQVSTNVIECKKTWRIQKNVYYDAYLREHASDPSKIDKLAVTGFFVRDSDYETYDTLQIVSNLVKACENDDLISTEEILNNIAPKDRYKEEEEKRKLFGKRKK
jgi:hypothetical protein